ncbi:hypothetical protein BCR42DRAFT_491267 [Absidia repens]|uniref:Uncharacterized protein n=1 Tax=Absidia repens TaxID=90262 RepID=A0A1X2IJ98_9FUNG|nr:hypothetical protein BCR42DRAFT_491267 [Absidia repens]
MPSKPIIYCCVPRPGIIFMSLIFGFCGLVPSISTLYSLHFISFKSFSCFIDCMDRDVDIISTFAFFYSAYLTYKRRYKPFKYLQYIFWTRVLFDVYNGIYTLKAALTVPLDQYNINKDMPYNATNNNGLTEEEYHKLNETLSYGVYAIMPFIMAFLILFPLLNKIYLIIKMKAYTDYVTYKKEEARPVPVIELPHKLPECSQ